LIAVLNSLISVDTLYFTDIGPTVQQMRWLLAPGGQMGVFYAHGVSPETPREAFRPETLAADKTPLGEALTKAGLRFDAIDMTAADYDHARLKKTVMEELRPALEAEGNLFLYTNRHGEAKGVMAAIEDGLHARYLYHIVV
jgi:hypothetical protein